MQIEQTIIRIQYIFLTLNNGYIQLVKQEVKAAAVVNMQFR